MSNRPQPVSAPRTFAELAGGVSAARALLASVGMVRHDGTGDRDALLLATGHVVLAGCSFRLSFERDMVLKLVGMVGGGSLMLATRGLLTVPARLSQTLATASLGKCISGVVAHPVLAVAPLVVTAAEPLTTSTIFELAPEVVSLVAPSASAQVLSDDSNAPTGGAQ